MGMNDNQCGTIVFTGGTPSRILMARYRLRTVAFATVLVGLAISTLALPTIGYGHARFVSSDPTPGAQLSAPPGQIVLRFNEPVQPLAVRLVDVAGIDHAAGRELTVVNTDVVLEVDPNLASGRYVVSYRVLSSDAHPIAASFKFLVAGEDAQSANQVMQAESMNAGSESRPDRSVALLLTRAVYTIGLLLSAGHALFVALVPLSPEQRRPHQRRMRRTALLTLVVGIAYLQLSGVVMLGSEQLLDADAIEVAIQSTLGRSVALAAVGVLLLSIFNRASVIWPLLIGVAFLVVSRAVTGHSASRGPVWLLAPVISLHVACAAFWYGSLWPLYRSLGSLPLPVTAAIVQQFSIIAIWAVALLLGAGILMSFIHLDAFTRLIDTWYGQLLLMKSFGFGIIVALASWHKLGLTPRLESGDLIARRQLRASIRLEAIIMSAVVLISAALASTSPEDPAPYLRQSTDSYRETSIISSSYGGFRAEVQRQDLQGSPRRFSLQFFDTAGDRISPLEVSVAVALRTIGVEDFPATVQSSGEGQYVFESELEIEGTWRISIDALVTEFDREFFVADIEVAARERSAMIYHRITSPV